MKIFSGLKTRKLTKAIEKYPDIFKNYQELITLYLEQENIDEASRYLQLAAEKSWDTDQNAWLNIQSLQLQIARNAEPSQLMETALAIAGDPQIQAETRLDAARAITPLLRSENLILSEETEQKTLDTLNAVIGAMEKNPETVDLLVSLAEFHNHNHRPREAAKSIETAMDRAEKLRLKKMGNLYYRAAMISRHASTDQQTIRNWFSKALESGDLSDDDTIEALAAIADFLIKDDDLLGAMERYETALRFAGSKKTSQLAMIRFRLARVYFQLNRVPQAEKEVKSALGDDLLTGDERAEVLLWFAEARQNQNQLSEARQHINEALKHVKNPKLQHTVIMRQILILEESEQFSEAVAILENIAIDADPETEFQLMRMYNLEGTSHKALKLVKSFQKDPQRLEKIGAHNVFRQEGIALFNQGKVTRGLESYLQVLDHSDPEDPVYIETRKHLQRLKKELQTPEGIKKYKLDGGDRKQLTGILAQIPDEADFFTRLRTGLMKTRSGLIGGIEKILAGRSEIDEDVLDEIEELMILSDLGVETTEKIIDGLREKLRKKELHNADVVRNHIRTSIEEILSGHSGSITPVTEAQPYIIMVVGVNGVGKTTTIAKIARRFSEEGKSILLAAGDTFRAGAIEQLQEWGRRLEIDVVAHDEGADPSAVAWDAVAAAKNREVDILIIDTAGRLHTKSNLMDELKKVNRVIGKNMAGAPHEVLLVLDATTGQNAVLQAREFSQATDLTGIALTKLDGTAKGGIIVSIVQELDIPIKLIGIGEQMDDLRDFDAEDFARALFDRGEDSADSGIDTGNE